MPRGDGTGPMGMGPMTGRAAGYCAGFSVPGFMNPGVGGFGRRGGFAGGGRGRRNWFYATGMPGWARAGSGMPAWAGAGLGFAAPSAPYVPSAQEQTGLLKQQAEFLEQQLEEVRQRLTELESEKVEK